jgi:hypothetical protein
MECFGGGILSCVIMVTISVCKYVKLEAEHVRGR